MMEEMVVPLLLTSSLTVVQGRTRFQKLVFLVQCRAKSKNIPSSSYRFEPYRYGPFSSELSEQLERLVASGYLTFTPETTPGGYTRYAYTLTNTGKTLLETLGGRRLIDRRLQNVVVSVA